jgi:hypothetical protein
MAAEVKIGGDNTVGLPVTLADGTNFVIPVVAAVDTAGNAVIRTNVDTGILMNVAGAAAGTTSGLQTNFGGRGIKLGLYVSAITGTSPTITITIQGYESVSGQYFTILTSAAITATGLYVLTVYPGIAAAANVSANDVLPRSWRLSTTIGGTGPSVTYTVGASIIL